MWSDIQPLLWSAPIFPFYNYSFCPSAQHIKTELCELSLIFSKAIAKFFLNFGQKEDTNKKPQNTTLKKKNTKECLWDMTWVWNEKLLGDLPF